MTFSKFRGDYVQLEAIAKKFAAQSDAVQGMIRDIASKMAVLQNGDWVGEGANTFYAEMNGDVLPSLQRLAKALQSSQTKTAQISREIKQAEDEAAAVLRDTGAEAVQGSTSEKLNSPVKSNNQYLNQPEFPDFPVPPQQPRFPDFPPIPPKPNFPDVPRAPETPQFPDFPSVPKPPRFPDFPPAPKFPPITDALKPDLQVFRSAVKECERQIGHPLTPEEYDELHDTVHDEGKETQWGYWEIVAECVAAYGGNQG